MKVSSCQTPGIIFSPLMYIIYTYALCVDTGADAGVWSGGH
jgi:hypothetical protein